MNSISYTNTQKTSEYYYHIKLKIIQALNYNIAHDFGTYIHTQILHTIHPELKDFDAWLRTKLAQ